MLRHSQQGTFKMISPQLPFIISKTTVLLFDLISMQDATENCHYPELVGEPLTLELSFAFRLEHVTELKFLGKRMSSVAVDKFDFVGEII